MNEIHIYPVGLLKDLQALRTGRFPLGTFWRWFRQSYRRRSYWNGYLAEPRTEAIYWTRCGHGWTKHRAAASLTRHIGEVQESGHLRYVPESAA